MKINNEVIQKLADLSKLKIDEKDVAGMTEELNKIVEWMDKLSEVNTDGVKPFIDNQSPENLLRQDITYNTFDGDNALRNAPDQHDGFFKVPKVIK